MTVFINQKDEESGKTVILDRLRESLMLGQIESKSVEELSKNVDNADDAVELTKKIGKVIKSKKSNILWLAYHQGIYFRKFKMNNSLTNAVTEFKISKTTINLKIDIVKFIGKNPKMRTSCISLSRTY